MINNSVRDGYEIKKTTPRIELSCVSSSLQKVDSHESSPENVFEQVGTGTLQEHMNLNYQDEEPQNLLEVTTSFMQQKKQKDLDCLQEHSQQKASSLLHICKSDEHQVYLQQHQRKDSASSEVAALLCTSGRSSRISSICSQGSAISHLSAASGISRSPSPHRMLLETSFCGPKPVNNLIDGNAGNVIESSTATSLEQILLSRTQDPTQAIFAEGVKLKNNVKKERKNGSDTLNNVSAFQNSEQISEQEIKPGQIIIGKTPSGTDYIRINLKPHHMYVDRGIGSNEKVVEAPNTLAPIYALESKQTKPISLTLPPKPVTERGEQSYSRIICTYDISPNETKENRSPSPVIASASRKSSFSSLFRFGGKDSPDLFKERSRSKCKERTAIQTTSSTPSKPNSFLTILKPGKRASSAGSDRIKFSTASSPTEVRPTCPTSNKSFTPVSVISNSNITSNNRLRYYDEPKEGTIHIPLHTPPEEKDIQKVFQDIQNLNSKPIKPLIAPITVNDLAAAAAALKPVILRSQDPNTNMSVTEPRQSNQMQSEENLDAIYPLSKECSENVDVIYRNISHDFLKSESLDNSRSSSLIYNKIQKSTEVELCRLPSAESSISGAEVKVLETKATINSNAIPQNVALHAKEKRKLLFATRLGSGSQDNLFSTQFSISKTESISSHMSEEHGVENFVEQGTIKSSSDLERQNLATTSLEQRSTFEKNSEYRKNEISTAKLQDEKLNASTWEMSDSNNINSEGQNIFSYSQNCNSISPLEENIDLNLTYTKNTLFVKDFKESEDYLNTLNESQISKKNQTQSSINKERNTASRFLSTEPLLTESTPLPSVELEINRTSESSLHFIPQLITAQCTHTPQMLLQVSNCTKKTQESESEGPIFTQTSSKKDQRQSIHETLESPESEKNSDAGISAIDDSKDYRPSNLVPSTHIYKSANVYKNEHESTGLVTQESFEDELPYIPTTLPEERSQGISLVPMKERAHIDLKTYPLERPRSTTPLNPSQLEEYLFKKSEQNNAFSTLNGSILNRGDKLRISLPKRGSKKYERQNALSPRKSLKNNEKTWLEFAEQGLRAVGNLEQKTGRVMDYKTNDNNQPIKIVAKSKEQIKKTTASSQRKLSGHWIDFENIPEKRKPPKRITTLPKDSVTVTERLQIMPQTKSTSQKLCSPNDKVFYNYVKPEDCHCECHEMYKENDSTIAVATETAMPPPIEDHLLQRDNNILPLINREENERNLLPAHNNCLNGEYQVPRQLFSTTPDSSQNNDLKSSMANSQHPN